MGCRTAANGRGSRLTWALDRTGLRPAAQRRDVRRHRPKEIKMRAIIVAAFVAGSFSAAIADDSPSPKQRAEKFFQALAEKGPGPAFDLLFEGSPITSQKPQA